MRNLSELCTEKRALIDRFIESYAKCRDCYNDDFEMQLCIEEDLACNEIYDEAEQEMLARYIVTKIEEKSETKGIDALIEGAEAVFMETEHTVSRSKQQETVIER